MNFFLLLLIFRIGFYIDVYSMFICGISYCIILIIGWVVEDIFVVIMICYNCYCLKFLLERLYCILLELGMYIWGVCLGLYLKIYV